MQRVRQRNQKGPRQVVDGGLLEQHSRYLRAGVRIAGAPSYPYPANPGYADPEAPFGRDPATGEPLSDKSAATAGVLQLFLGVFGVGRFYIESTQIAVIQLCLGVVGMFFTAFCLIGLPVLIGVSIWALVDAIMIFSGNVRDKYGRKLR